MTTEFIIVGLLPSMAADLGVSVSQAGLLVTLFALTVAAAGPFLTARLVGYERKKLFIFTLLLFALSNLVAAGASNIWVMALARFIPALILPVFWSLASDTAVQITGPENAGKAISLVSFGIVAATIFGFPHEIVRPPHSLAERVFRDIRRWSVMPRGGHFAAMEQPEALAQEITVDPFPLHGAEESILCRCHFAHVL